MEDILYIYERDLAWSALREWLASPVFKPRAPLNEVLSQTQVGKEIEARQSEHWQWWLGDCRGKELRKLLRRIPEIWEEKGWATTEITVRGRPRRVQYGDKVLSKARAIYSDGHQGETESSTFRWAESVLGETVRQETVYLVIVSASVYREFAESVGPKGIEGKTREELSEQLDLAKPVANDFVRWLLSTGQWEVAQVRTNGERQRQLRRISNEET